MAEREPRPIVCQFIERLAQLDPGDRARFKRNAGFTLAESRNVISLFYRILPHEVPAAQEELYFLIATLFPLADAGDRGDFGAALRRARQDKNAPGLDRRVEILLDADEMQLPFRLRQAVRFLASKKVPINWQEMLESLCWWKHPKRLVQRRWARSYFAASAAPNDIQPAPQNQPELD